MSTDAHFHLVEPAKVKASFKEDTSGKCARCLFFFRILKALFKHILTYPVHHKYDMAFKLKLI